MFVGMSIAAEINILCSKRFGGNNQKVKPPSVVKSLQLHGICHIDLVPVELQMAQKTLYTNEYPDNGSCRSLRLQSAASELYTDMNTVASQKFPPVTTIQLENSTVLQCPSK